MNLCKPATWISHRLTTIISLTFQLPSEVVETHEVLKSHWVQVNAAIDGQSADFREQNGELIDQVSINQHMLQLRFEDAERELLNEIGNTNDVNQQQQQRQLLVQLIQHRLHLAWQM